MKNIVKSNYIITSNKQITLNHSLINHIKDNTMKRVLLLTLGVLGVLLLGITTEALSRGTPAGTVIKNTAVLNYKDLAGNSFAPDSASVSITVAQLPGVDLEPPTAAQTVGDSIYVYYPFTVNNTGNGTDTYDLKDTSTILVGWNPQIYVDANRNGVLDSAELAAGPVTVSSALAEDSTEWFIERLFVPFNTLSGTVDTVHPWAGSQYSQVSGTDTTFSRGTYVTTIWTAAIKLVKTATSAHPIPQPTPTTETYNIAYSDTGLGTADSLVITDIVSSNLTVVGGSIGGGNSHTFSGDTITWTITRVGAGGTGNVSFQATVNKGVPSGTVINNLATATFTDSTNQHREHGNPSNVNVTVADFAQLKVTLSPTPDTVDVGLVAKDVITLTNDGNYTDSESFAFRSSLPLGWTFWTDSNHTHALNFADVDAGGLPESTSVTFYALDTIPTHTPDKSIDTLSIGFTSIPHNSISADTTGITLIRAPILTLVKSDSVQVGTGGGTLQNTPIPGSTIVYTIIYADTGTGAASGLVVTDSIPHGMHGTAAWVTYVPGSVTWNGTPVADGAAGNPSATSPVTINVGALASKANGIIRFKVIINPSN
jgi:uncharacterized repeat protein (TIGR01451 family)